MKQYKKILATVLAAVTALSMPLSASAAWRKEADGNWKWLVDGKAHIGWVLTGGKWYYMDPDGNMATGWKKINGKWYFLNANGDMATGWVKAGGKWYYTDPVNGDMKSGVQEIDGRIYVLGDAEDGAMKTGFLKIDGKTCFAGEYGLVTGVVQIDGAVYYFDEKDASMQTGKVQIDGKTYRFNEEGECVNYRKPAAREAFTTETDENGETTSVEETEVTEDTGSSSAGGGSISGNTGGGSSGGEGGSSGPSTPSTPTEPAVTASIAGVDVLDEVYAGMATITQKNSKYEIQLTEAYDGDGLPVNIQITTTNIEALYMGPVPAGGAANLVKISDNKDYHAGTTPSVDLWMNGREGFEKGERRVAVYADSAGTTKLAELTFVWKGIESTAAIHSLIASEMTDTTIENLLGNSAAAELKKVTASLEEGTKTITLSSTEPISYLTDFDTYAPGAEGHFVGFALTIPGGATDVTYTLVGFDGESRDRVIEAKGTAVVLIKVTDTDGTAGIEIDWDGSGTKYEPAGYIIRLDESVSLAGN